MTNFAEIITSKYYAVTITLGAMSAIGIKHNLLRVSTYAGLDEYDEPINEEPDLKRIMDSYLTIDQMYELNIRGYSVNINKRENIVDIYKNLNAHLICCKEYLNGINAGPLPMDELTGMDEFADFIYANYNLTIDEMDIANSVLNDLSIFNTMNFKVYNPTSTVKKRQRLFTGAVSETDSYYTGADAKTNDVDTTGLNDLSLEQILKTK